MSKRSGCLISIVGSFLAWGLILFLAGCSTTPPAPPEPITVIKEVERIVQVKCEDKRAPKPEYPDTTGRLAMIEEGDIFGLAQAYLAGKMLREAREIENEAQIKACAGE